MDVTCCDNRIACLLDDSCGLTVSTFKLSEFRCMSLCFLLISSHVV